MNRETTTGLSQPTIYPVALPENRRARPALATLMRLLPVLALLACAPFVMRTDSGLRYLMAATLFLAIHTMLRSGLGVVFALVYLAVLGGLRRLLIPWMGWPGNDPLLLICPAVVTLYFLSKAFAGQLPRDTRLARGVLWLLLIMGLQMFNPAQGGLAIGLGGAMFYMVPMLWYYVGRDLGTPLLLHRLLWATAGISVAAALYGLYQTFYGFTSFEQEWVRIGGYTALNVGNGIRAISFFTSAAEYDWFLAIGFVVCWAVWLRCRNFAVLLPLPLLAAGIFYESGRSPIVSTLFACAVLIAIQGRSMASWFPRGAIALALGIVGLIWSMQQVQNASHSEATQGLVEHQTEGFLNPFDEKKSTVNAHATMIRGGFFAGFSSPLGSGLGATTLAASKYGGASNSTELDVSNMLVSLGMVGGLLYAGIIAYVLVLACRHWHKARTLVALTTLGILVALLGQWLNGQQYSTSMLIWFCVGALDRMYREAKALPSAVSP